MGCNRYAGVIHMFDFAYKGNDVSQAVKMEES